MEGRKENSVEYNTIIEIAKSIGDLHSCTLKLLSGIDFGDLASNFSVVVG